MDEHLHTCLWMVGGGGFGCMLGAIFGALAAAVYERNGGVAGTRLARSLVENLLQSGDRQPSPTLHAALIGAADGHFFVGSLGLIAGALLGKSGPMANGMLMPVMVGSVLLAGGAILFGSMAYVLRYRAAEFLYAFAGSMIGGFVVGNLLGVSVYGSAGLVPGMILGLLICRAVRAYSPKFHQPDLAKTMPQPLCDGNTDITNSPTSRQNSDFFINEKSNPSFRREQ